MIEQLTTLAGSAANPADYARQMVARLFPTMLPYELHTPAASNFAGFNGRALTDDVMDVILTIASLTLQPYEFRGHYANRRVASYGFRYNYLSNRIESAAMCRHSS